VNYHKYCIPKYISAIGWLNECFTRLQMGKGGGNDETATGNICDNITTDIVETIAESFHSSG